MTEPPTSQQGIYNQGIYNWSLLFAFIANAFQLTSVSLLFRYSDFVANIGGNEWHLGWVVGVASIGAVLSRLFLGSAVDRIGPAKIWYISLVGQIAGLAGHLFIASPNTWQIYLVRMIYATSLAGSFGAWFSFVTLQVPVHRVAEVLGVIGASGFIGMAAGPIIGDAIFQNGTDPNFHIQSMFVYSIAALILTTAFAVASCRTGRLVKLEANTAIRNPILVIRKSKPGYALVLGALMGLTIGFPGTYLRPMGAALGIEEIRLFFITYNLTAFVSRLINYRAPQILGLKKTISVGYAFMAISMLLYLFVNSERDLIFPALAGGVAHSFLFPSVIASCTEKFKPQDRGVATNLILAAYDTGLLIGMPMIGAILTWAEQSGIPPYSTAVVSIAGIILTTIIIYWWQEGAANTAGELDEQIDCSKD